MNNRTNVTEYMLSMFPEREHRVEFDEMVLDDNLDPADAIYERDVDYVDCPVRSMFAMLLFCCEGRLSMRINLVEHELLPKDMLIITPGVIVDEVHIRAGCRVFAYGLPINHYSHGHIYDPLIQQFLAEQPDRWLFHFSSDVMQLQRRLYQMMREAITDEHLAYKKEVVSGYTHVVAAYILDALKRQQTEASTKPQQREAVLLSQFVDLVARNYREHREVSFYADKMCISPKYLSVVVSKASSRRPTDWIREYVILDAKAMILSGDYTIQQISDRLNFANASFFGKYFKEAVGCSPGQFTTSVLGAPGFFRG